MREAQGFLLVFSLTSSSSLDELHELREQIQQIKNDTDVPIVLVGNKSDLEDNRRVSCSTGIRISKSWRTPKSNPYWETSPRKDAVPYYETSARQGQHTSEVFVDICRQIIKHDIARAATRQEERTATKGKGHDRPRRRCTIL